jgi:hypothetical protein
VIVFWCDVQILICGTIFILFKEVYVCFKRKEKYPLMMLYLHSAKIWNEIKDVWRWKVEERKFSFFLFFSFNDGLPSLTQNQLNYWNKGPSIYKQHFELDNLKQKLFLRLFFFKILKMRRIVKYKNQATLYSRKKVTFNPPYCRCSTGQCCHVLTL